MAPAPPPSLDPPTVVVTELKSLGGGVWSVLLTFPDLSTRRLVVPKEIADLNGIRLSVGVVAELNAQGALG